MTDLEKFRDLLSRFVAWWNEMEMESNTQLTRESMMIQKFDSLRLKSIEARWKDHRKRYAAYVDEVSATFMVIWQKFWKVHRLGESKTAFQIFSPKPYPDRIVCKTVLEKFKSRHLPTNLML
jgi:hypothetical protein